MRKAIALCAAALASPALAVPPEVPLLVSVHGRLLQGDDSPVEGQVSVRFALYDVQENPTGEAIEPLWSATYTVSVHRGEFAALLGDTSSGQPALPQSFFDGAAPRWLGIKVADDGEGRPRIPVTSVPFALIAGRAVRADVAADAEKLGGETPASFHDASRLTGTLPPAVLGASASNISSVGTIISGEWEGAPIEDAYIAGAADWNAKLDAVARDGSLKGDGTAGAPLGVVFGTGAGTAAAGNDARFTDLADAITGAAAAAVTDAVAAANAATDTKLAGYLTRSEAANTYVAKSGGGLGVATTGANTAMNPNDAINVTHPADPNRQVTVLVQTPQALAVFYVDAEDGVGKDLVNNVSPSVYSSGTSVSVASSGKFGSKSLYASDWPAWFSWNLPSGTLNFGTGDFTIRLWFKTNQGYVNGGYWANFAGNASGDPGAVSESWTLGLVHLGGMRWYHDGVLRFDQNYSSKYAAGTWYHAAFERYNGAIYWYINGALQGSAFADANQVGSNSRNTLYVGCLLDWDNVPEMYFDEIEVIKSAMYRGVSFTPPTSPSPALPSGTTGAWQAVSDATKFRVEYLNDTTTRVTKLSSGAESVRVVVRTFQ